MSSLTRKPTPPPTSAHHTNNGSGAPPGAASSSSMAAVAAATIANVHALECDGVARHLFSYLLKMQHALRRSQHQHAMETDGSNTINPMNMKIRHRHSSSSGGGCGGNGGSTNPSELDKGSEGGGGSGAAASNANSSTFAETLRANATSTAPSSWLSVDAAAASAISNGNIILPIPDTIVYENNFPQAWYSYDKKSNEMLKMPGRKLDANEIIEGFSVLEASGCGGICAQFTSVVTDNETGKIETETIYFNPTTLVEWVHNKDNLYRKEGVLQRFIPPRGENNDAMLVTWSPHLCTMTRRQNIHRIDTTRVPLRNKACTFDGPPHLSIETMGNATVKKRISTMLSAVAAYLLQKERRVVSRFVGLFKQDVEGNVWLLHMTSIRIQNDTLLEANTRDPVEMTPAFTNPASACPNPMIKKALSLNVTLDGPSVFRDRRKYCNDSQSILQVSPQPLQRKDTMEVLEKTALLSRDHEGLLPQEYKQLDSFIEDTLYLIYSSRMTTFRGGGDFYVVGGGGGGGGVEFQEQQPVVELTLSTSLQRFLGESAVERLMLRILCVEPLMENCDGSIVFRTYPTVGKKTLNEARKECDAFLSDIRRPFTSLIR